MAGPPKKKANTKKILAIVLPIVTLLIVGVIVLIVLLAGGKTSAKALTDFSDSTSSLNSSLQGISSGIRTATLTGKTDQLEDQVSDANSALDAFDLATNSIKSDHQDLKDAAQDYSTLIRAFLSDEVAIVSDVAKINSFVSVNEPVFDTSTSSDRAAYIVEAGRIGDLYGQNSVKVKSLSMQTDDGEELRDLYVTTYKDLQALMSRLLVAVEDDDSSEVLVVTKELTTLLSDGDAAVKTEELKDKLGADGDAYKSLDGAEDRLNDLITSINNKR